MACGMEGQQPLGLNCFHNKIGGARWAVQHNITLMELLKLRHKLVRTRRIPMSIAGGLRFLPYQVTQDSVGPIIPPIGISVPAGAVVTHLDKPRPDAFWRRLDADGVGSL